MKDYTIADFLNKNAAAGNVSFHMPGHKGRSALYDEAGYGQLLKNAAASTMNTVVWMINVILGVFFQCLSSSIARSPSTEMKWNRRMQNGHVDGPHLPVSPNRIVTASMLASDETDA
jgi:hypothetical protein